MSFGCCQPVKLSSQDDRHRFLQLCRDNFDICHPHVKNKHHLQQVTVVATLMCCASHVSYNTCIHQCHLHTLTTQLTWPMVVHSQTALAVGWCQCQWCAVVVVGRCSQPRAGISHTSPIYVTSEHIITILQMKTNLSSID